MSNTPLVTMITYCYNGERFVSKYFDAILAQTYPNIELIFFNNGSKDKTGEIAESYRARLEEKGVLVNIVHYEENQSTCMLKQKGLQMMKGEYFFGCDSDDYIDSNYIQEMVDYLQSNPEKGIVYCQLRVVEEESGKVLSIMKMTPRYNHHEAFRDILSGYNINFTAISYMMSRKHLEKVNPNKEIYMSRYGENYQVQMPFLYYDLQGYIEKPLGQYTVRRDSYTGQLNYEKKYEALKGQEESVINTMKQLNMSDYDYYSAIFLKRIRRERFYTASIINNRKYVKESYKELKQVKGVNFKIFCAYALGKIGLPYLKWKHGKKGKK